MQLGIGDDEQSDIAMHNIKIVRKLQRGTIEAYTLKMFDFLLKNEISLP